MLWSQPWHLWKRNPLENFGSFEAQLSSRPQLRVSSTRAIHTYRIQWRSRLLSVRRARTSSRFPNRQIRRWKATCEGCENDHMTAPSSVWFPTQRVWHHSYRYGGFHNINHYCKADISFLGVDLKPTNILLELKNPSRTIANYLSEVPARTLPQRGVNTPLREVIPTSLVSEIKSLHVRLIDFGVGK